MTLVTTAIIVLLYFLFMLIYPKWYLGYDNDGVGEFWHKWQTLTGSVIALGAGVGVVWSTLRASGMTIQASQNEERLKKERTFNAERALLTFALVEVTTYCQNIARVYDNLIFSGIFADSPSPSNLQEKVKDLKLVLPDKLNQEVFSVIRGCIMYAPDEVADYLSKLLNEIQICHTRFESLLIESYPDHHIRTVIETTIFGLVKQLCEIHGMAGNLFAVARQREEEFSTEIDLLGQLKMLDLKSCSILEQHHIFS